MRSAIAIVILASTLGACSSPGPRDTIDAAGKLCPFGTQVLAPTGDLSGATAAYTDCNQSGETNPALLVFDEPQERENYLKTGFPQTPYGCRVIISDWWAYRFCKDPNAWEKALNMGGHYQDR